MHGRRRRRQHVPTTPKARRRKPPIAPSNRKLDLIRQLPPRRVAKSSSLATAAPLLQQEQAIEMPAYRSTGKIAQATHARCTKEAYLPVSPTEAEVFSAR